jgi:hypothetical protein
MKWRKLGQIFETGPHQFGNQQALFAQSPQAIEFDTFIRIYFSTRKKDPVNGKFISEIAFADMSKDLQQLIKISDKPIIGPGALGAFDEHGIFPISPLRHDGKIWAYTCGWSRRVSVSVETSTGLAVSTDNGLTFERFGTGPVFSSSLHEPMLVGDSFVRIYNDVFHMWYIYADRWLPAEGTEPPARVYKIAHAISKNGIDWERNGKFIIKDRLNDDECQALPTVVKIAGRYHMYFCFREAKDFRTNTARGYRIGYAWSDNLLDWTRNDIEGGITTSDKGWDSEMMCYPHIFECAGKVYLLYNGNEFGKYGFGAAILESI